MIIRTLSFLLHHANRESKSDHFYAIKKKLLQGYGELVGHDVQYIAGKKCNSCGGSGQHAKYSYSGKIYDWADCYHCQWGWYKLPQWNILERYQFGRYVFHQPLKRVYSKNQVDVPIGNKIEGYIEHKHSEYGSDCLTVLYILYDFKRWWKEFSIGRGYFYKWNSPYRFINNIIHICRRGRTSIPFQMWGYIPKKNKTNQVIIPAIDDDLPF